jgi:hypothetical protein
MLQIQAGIPRTIPVFNLIGETSISKIAFAQVIDFFITNCATGSIYVARFGKKPGLAHISNAMSLNAWQHIHHRTTKVSCEHVTDVITDTNQRDDFVSYHITPKTITNLTMKIMLESSLIHERIKEYGRPLSAN